jgi:hypothetical protein
VVYWNSGVQGRLPFPEFHQYFSAFDAQTVTSMDYARGTDEGGSGALPGRVQDSVIDGNPMYAVEDVKATAVTPAD